MILKSFLRFFFLFLFFFHYASPSIRWWFLFVRHPTAELPGGICVLKILKKELALYAHMLEMNDGLLVCGSSSGPVLRCWWTFSSKQDEKAPWSGDKPSASARLWPIACDRWFSPKKAPFAQKINNIYIYIFYSLDRRNKSKSREFQSRVWTPRDWSWSHSPMTYKIFRFFLQSHDISWNFVTKHFWQLLKKKWEMSTLFGFSHLRH